MDGYIYILRNSHYNNLLKIGQTQRNPSERARELSSSTGVPGKFEVEYQLAVPECDKVEKLIHEKLKQHRDKKGKEFFNVSLDVAKDVIKNISIAFINENISKLENELEGKVMNYRLKLIDEINNKKKLLDRLLPKEKQKKMFIYTASGDKHYF